MDKPALVNVLDTPVHARTGPTAPAIVISAFAAGRGGDGLVKTGAWCKTFTARVPEASQRCGQTRALIDGAFGVEFERFIGAANDVHLGAARLQRLDQLAQRFLARAQHD